MNAKEGRNFKEASDLQLGLIFQLILGLLKIHSSQSNPQQAVLTIPSQLKPLSVNTSGGVQTILMPVNKGESFTCGVCGTSRGWCQDGNAWLDTHVVLENGRISMGKIRLVSEVGSLLGLPCMSSG